MGGGSGIGSSEAAATGNAPYHMLPAAERKQNRGGDCGGRPSLGHCQPIPHDGRAVPGSLLEDSDWKTRAWQLCPPVSRYLRCLCSTTFSHCIISRTFDETYFILQISASSLLIFVNYRLSYVVVAS